MNTVILRTCAVALTFIVFGSCDSEREQQLIAKQQKDLAQKDSLIGEYVTTLNEIDVNLDAIRDTRGMIILGPESNVDENVSKREQIMRNISMISLLLENKQQKLEELEKELAASGTKVNSLRAVTKSYEQKIKESQAEIESLKTQLASAQATNAELEKAGSELRSENGQLKQQNEVLNVQITELDRTSHTAWYTMGTAKKLREEKVISTEGNLLTGKTYKLSGDLNRTQFAEVSTREPIVLSINSAKARLITSHPDGSYKLNKTEEGKLQLQITEPELFWSLSRYLVIETKT